MRKQPFYLLPLALLLWGCPGQSNEEPEPEKVCLLQEQSKTNVYEGDPPQTFSNRFTYNTDKRLVAVALDSAGIEINNATLTYDSRGNLTQVVDNRTRLVNAYGTQNRLQKQTRFDKGGAGAFQERDYYTFSYATSGDLAEARYFYSASGTASQFYIFRYTYTNGNPTQLTQLDTREQVLARSVHTYDTNPSPRPALAYFYFQPMQAPAANNELSATRTDSGRGNLLYEVAYTYKEDGYPASGLQTHLHNNAQEQLAFRYTCD